MVKIYKITNLINNKMYIGQTIQDINIRFKQHGLGMGYGKMMPIHLAIQKYGKQAFIIEEIATCIDNSVAGFLEVYFINFFNTLAPNGYNVDFNTKYLRDNPYLIERNKNLSAVQSLEDEPATAEYNSSKRPQYPYDLWIKIKNLYDEGKSPSEINKFLNLTIDKNTMVKKLRGLGSDTSNKTRNKIRGNCRFFLSEEEKQNIINDFKIGLTCVELEKKYNRASRPIKRILVAAGLYVSKDKNISRPLE